MLPRILEPEVMDSPSEARDYDAMDHGQVNARFVADFLALHPEAGPVLDVGTGTAQIPIELCRRTSRLRVVAIDLAASMLALAQANVRKAGLASRIELRLVDAKGIAGATASYAAVISNSILHHIPQPLQALAEMVRLCQPGGTLFVRDLFRPQTHGELAHLVQTYAGDANAHQQKMFADSLHAALTVDEVRGLVATLGFAADTVSATSDRHWTWAARK